MKQLFIIVAILTSIASVHAKNHNIVLRPTGVSQKGHTEVYDNGASDTLTVIPATDATTIHVLIKDVEGNVQDSHLVAANAESQICIFAPSRPDGYFLEVRDDRETVYTSYETE